MLGVGCSAFDVQRSIWRSLFSVRFSMPGPWGGAFYAAPCLISFPTLGSSATISAVTGVPSRRSLDHRRQPALSVFWSWTLNF